MNTTAESGYREQIHDLPLLPAALTEWGVPVLGIDGLRQITSGHPSGYAHIFHQGNFIEWLDPQTGGVAVVLHRQKGPITELSGLPEAISTEETLSNDNTVGESPVRYGGFAASLARHVGLRVLAHSDLITAVQIPGIRDYETAYTVVNGRPPDITPNPTYPDRIEGREFLEIVSAGQWPYDTHFFDTHAPSFVIGGPEFMAATLGLARRLGPASPIDEIDELGGEIDDYTDIFVQVTAAMTRVQRFGGSGRVDHLYTDNDVPGDINPQNKAVMRRFNGVLARHLGITLPATESSDVAIPL